MHILVVTGASGVGKTTAVRALAERGLPGVQCFHFDSIGVPSAEEMVRTHGSGEQWQAWATAQWLRELDQLDSAVHVAVLDGQTRPSFVAAASASVHRRVHTVLLDCERRERDVRLHHGRAQPELATDQMAAWAAYLREQANTLGLEVVDTSLLSPQSVADSLTELVRRLLAHAA